ncbi:MAG: nucleotide sugar dehydrogenase, partial [Firmicutes bacterium]|nr:nucleotide sugar dehydrogenase [Bacillota bacterium]
VGYHPNVILAGREINIGMGKYIADQTVKVLISKSLPVKDSAVLILGFTFKENIRDIRNTRVIDIYHELNQYGVRTYVYDPLASPTDVEEEYGLKLINHLNDLAPYQAIIIAVKHAEFYDLKLSYLRTIAADNPVIIDIKAIYDKHEAENCGFTYWRL